MSTENKDNVKKNKAQKYIAPTVLVLVIFDDEYEIYRTLYRLAEQEGIYPEELVVINIGKRKKDKIGRSFTDVNKKIPTDNDIKNRFTGVEIKKSEVRGIYDVRYIANCDFKKVIENDFLKDSEYKSPSFSKDHIEIISPQDFVKNPKVLNEKIREIYGVIKARKTTLKKISIKLPIIPIISRTNSKIDRIEEECKKYSQYFRSYVVQEQTITANSKNNSYIVDMVCDKKTIHLCISNPELVEIARDRYPFSHHHNFYDLLIRNAFLMGRISRKHDLVSLIESKYRGSPINGGYNHRQGAFSLGGVTALLPRYILEYGTKINFLPIERGFDELKGESDIPQGAEAEEHSNKVFEIPTIEFNTEKSDSMKNMYLVTFNEKKIFLSHRCATYLYSWLNIKKSMLIDQNKELGFIKAQNYCILHGATNDDVKTPIAMIKYIGENLQSKMQVVIGKAYQNISIALRKKSPTQTGKALSKKKKDEIEKYPNIDNMSEEDLQLLLDQEQIGGYLGGGTENNDKTKFLSFVASQLEGTGIIEWLTPKSIHKIVTSEKEFEMLKAIYKTANESEFKASLASQLSSKESIEPLSMINEISTSDYKKFKVATQKGGKSDLVKFLIQNDRTWATYKKIIRKHSCLKKSENVGTYKELIGKYTDIKKLTGVESTNPNASKKFVSVLTDYEIIDGE